MHRTGTWAGQGTLSESRCSTTWNCCSRLSAASVERMLSNEALMKP